MDALTRRDLLEWAMAESVPVRCPACRREHLYTAPSYPCVCGAPVTTALDRLAEPTPVTHRAWDEDWAEVRCEACGRETEWPRPELGCPCGTTLRIPVRGVRAVHRPGGAETAPGATDTTERDGTNASARGGDEAGHRNAAARNRRDGDESGPPDGGGNRLADGEREQGAGASASTGAGRRIGRDVSPARRPAFQPVTIRTARDAVTAAALYLRWLGYRDIRRADQRPPSGIGLAARGILAQVAPTVRPASLRDVECLWLTAMTESAECAFFSLAGYADDARARADTLRVPLFVLDLTGTPQPVNSPADDLIAVTG
ncbi:hypothetical protein [Streptomyces sp. NPDC005046]